MFSQAEYTGIDPVQVLFLVFIINLPSWLIWKVWLIADETVKNIDFFFLKAKIMQRRFFNMHHNFSLQRDP